MLEGFLYRKLTVDFQKKPFDCGDFDLNDFFLKDAVNYLRQLLTVTYVFESDKETVAFFSVLNDNIINQDSRTQKTISNKLARKIPNEKRRPSYPAVKIGRLGVHINYQCHGIGCEIIDFIKVLFTDDNKTGCRFITVDAYNNERTTRFYSNNGFKFLTETDKNDDTRLMYFDLMTFIRQ